MPKLTDYTQSFFPFNDDILYCSHCERPIDFTDKLVYCKKISPDDPGGTSQPIVRLHESCFDNTNYNRIDI